MRRSEWLVSVVALVLGGAGAGVMACAFNTDVGDCNQYPRHGCPGYSAAGGGSSTGTLSGSGGTGGGTPIVCTGDPSAPVDAGAVQSGNIRDECAVFVRADAVDAGTPDGTMEKPYATLQAALQNAGGKKKVYACASATFAEAVNLTAGLEVYGGFSCTSAQWTWSSTAQTALMGPADSAAFTIGTGADGALVSNFSITGASPSDPMGGGSAIGVAVADVMATLKQSTVEAKDGAAGADGVTPSGTPSTGASAAMLDPTTMNACLNVAAVKGGVPGMTSCDDGMTGGGVGGTGGIPGTNMEYGVDGASGTPTGAVNAGKGETTVKCTDGTVGNDGTPGIAGPGGAAFGALSLTSLTTTEDVSGQAGSKAQGGGGGGGAKGGNVCPSGGTTFDGPGASGGGAGAGGCGGKGGGGGSAGGSSIAVIALGSNLTITDVTMKTGNGGVGGNGARGQAGAAGGSGTSGGTGSGLAGSRNGCAGGAGGTGGDGGPGGGGRGGHSIGVAFAKAPLKAPMVAAPGGTPGMGGTAGTGAPATSDGAMGLTGAQCDFSATPPACK